MYPRSSNRLPSAGLASSLLTGDEHGVALSRSVYIGDAPQPWNRIALVLPQKERIAGSPRRRVIRHGSLHLTPVSYFETLVVDSIDRRSGVRLSRCRDGGVSSPTSAPSCRREHRLMRGLNHPPIRDLLHRVVRENAVVFVSNRASLSDAGLHRNVPQCAVREMFPVLEHPTAGAHQVMETCVKLSENAR